MIAIATDRNSVSKTYTWGLDLSGSLQGAGGVGGLLSITKHEEQGTKNPYYPSYDANGNISEYVDASDNVVAHYEYSPFGKITSSSGSKADDFNHRFSTKYRDKNSETYYYGMRYYMPTYGRWISRDPLGDQGSIGAGLPHESSTYSLSFAITRLMHTASSSMRSFKERVNAYKSARYLRKVRRIMQVNGGQFLLRKYDPITGTWSHRAPSLPIGSNEYEAFLSNPQKHLDPIGLDIWIEDHGLHQRIRVGNEKGRTSSYSFGITKKWHIFIPPPWRKGEVYKDWREDKGEVTKELETSSKEDKKAKEILDEMVGTKMPYGLTYGNCRTFCQDMFEYFKKDREFGNCK